MDPSIGWLLSIVLIAVGFAGIVLPALPGTILILAGIFAGAWADGFARIGWVALTVCTVLALLSWVLDYAAAVLGAKRAGASKLALWGAAIGTVVGIFMGFVGIFFMPLVGAAIGELIARRNHGQALRVGIATWIGLLAGMLGKLLLALVMVGIYVVALFV
ncbi:DUF456 domain-containing protein [Ramlibacter sp. PS4R-6]|uniref:DUF456 domain-containing protein n=1 Tax=Ramlibacter sp. PS4R-6 TaxID=3133438 RepID=UPI0030AC7464